jgi:hypothetical protein
MKINFTEEKSLGFSKEQIESIIAELDSLNKMYPNVEIKEMGDFYTRDYMKYMGFYLNSYRELGKQRAEEKLLELHLNCPTFDTDIEGKFYNENTASGEYVNSALSIYFNHAMGSKRNKPLSQYLEEREKRNKIIETRRKINPSLLKYIKAVENGNTIECVVQHEYGHALDYKYNIAYSGEMMVYFASLTKDDISFQLGEYANKDIREFIASAFMESLYEDSSEIGLKVKEIVNKIVKEKDGK